VETQLHLVRDALCSGLKGRAEVRNIVEKNETWEGVYSKGGEKGELSGAQKIEKRGDSLRKYKKKQFANFIKGELTK